METKSLLIGITSFIAGGLLVSIAAVTFDKPQDEMMNALESKSGQAYDEAFISEMIAHHEGAVEMAKLSKERAQHDEIKQLSEAIISAQESEISQMKQWQHRWGFKMEASAGHAM